MMATSRYPTREGSVFDGKGYAKWDQALSDLTPVEQLGGMLFKREDKFAPMGEGGINGSKLRQCIYLVSEAARRGVRGCLTAASVRSPQLSSLALVAAHYGLPATLIIGGKPSTCLRHSNVAIAAAAGADFIFAKVAYNPALQRMARDYMKERGAGMYMLEYGIAPGSQAPPEEILAFHELGAWQVTNLPEEMEDLILPAGSCNTAASVLYGIAKTRPRRLRRIHMFGIGPNKLKFLANRLASLGRQGGLEALGIYNPHFPNNPVEEQAWTGGANAPYRLFFHDLHGTHYTGYDDEIHEEHCGLRFHPRYEGKIWRYMKDIGALADLMHPQTVFWNVGIKPRPDAMPELVVPSSVRLAEVAA